jgi:hypothetical protein
MYQLSKEQVKMFVRVMMPILYSMNDVAGMYDALDSGKPPEQQHQRGHRPDSPRIACLKARAAMAEATSMSPTESTGEQSGRGAGTWQN